MIGRRSLILGAGLALTAGGGCAPKPVAPPSPPPPRRGLDRLVDLCPSAGLRTIARARLGELLQPGMLGKPLAELVDRERLDALADLLGFDPRLADEVVAADYGASTLLLFRVAHDPEVVERRFRERVPGEVSRVVHEPGVLRVGGTIGTTPRSLLLLDERVIGLEVGGDVYARAVVGFLTGKLTRAKPALRTEPLASLHAALAQDAEPPLWAVGLNPPHDPWKLGAHGLLELTTAAGFAATPTADGLEVAILLAGAYGPDEAPVRARLEATVRDVTRSPLGSLTGVGDPDVRYAYAITPERLSIRTRWDALRLARGLHAATAATIAEIVKK